MKKVILTQNEWFEALKLPTPHRNRKKYRRKKKHKKNGNSLDCRYFFSYIHVFEWFERLIKNKGYVIRI